MRRTNETYFRKFATDPTAFGGSLLRGNPRGRRPLDHHKAVHMTFRSEEAKGPRRLLKHDHRILQALERLSRRFGVTVYMFANAGNHLHLLLRPTREVGDFHGFVRAFSGVVARIAMGAERGAAKKVKFWARRPWSRLVSFGKPFRVVYAYVRKNIMEAVGILEAAEMEDLLRSWRQKAKPS